MKVLVTGGVRSGKSRHAESLLAAAGAVAYVAPGPVSDDADWAERIAAHRAARPASWTTLETHDLATGLATEGPVIVDCLGTWLTALLDDHALWEASTGEATGLVRAELAKAIETLAARTADTVLVTNEVGLGVVPSHRSGRVFRDLLGLVNQELAAACDEVHLVIAGRVLTL
ncbi:bifunctional adenosylcobinamide kinase/adenosylcobinamide-phosphate guanylyltransferase [Nocardioides nematodiphilus]|uniref:bifunctional adenosylcobinamide kinase/adenosylcobinamide-phosphate guanylyltransferase n=1 Tax=Nocardioides nematodiphilus TaxID=2849669 RepID=UPI001CDA2940|nr:bifunctional adenosylcobinamide kinase/adenosylcobinamide-phosphate guanylyltransferase [Nocardioides nematodiphilus]MCA1982375.1 bifunctional adenosylcobinamide kinase/adenosylcobinamide-phosphate guanylyltransferase [Nocardioides nematodiphilus]